jgi:hypothetical protein
MAVITFEEFFELMKTEVCLVVYNKGGDIGKMGIKCTLLKEHIPTGHLNSVNLERSIEWNDLYLLGTDSSKSQIQRLLNTKRILHIGEFLKVYSLNYGAWFNLEIAKMMSVQIVDIPSEGTE